jgi:hypothetical protein
LGYLPRVLFFNAFELGAVIWKDAHVGAIKELKAKAPYKNLKQERCRGDDLRGMPCTELLAGWRPRSLHGSKIGRPAPPGEPAVPVAGWRFHRGRPEPGDEDKSPPTAVLPKVGWPR